MLKTGAIKLEGGSNLNDMVDGSYLCKFSIQLSHINLPMMFADVKSTFFHGYLSERDE